MIEIIPLASNLNRHTWFNKVNGLSTRFFTPPVGIRVLFKLLSCF